MAAKSPPKNPQKKPKKAANKSATAKKPASKSKEAPEKKEIIKAAEFARRMKLTKGRVSRGIESKILSKSVRRDGGQWGITWPDAREEWNANKQWEHDPDPMNAAAGRNLRDSDPANPESKRYQLSRAMREEFSARKMELEFLEMAGTLVHADEVRREAARTAKRVRDSLMSLPTKLTPRLVVMNDPHEIEQALTDAFIDLLKDMRNAFHS